MNGSFESDTQSAFLSPIPRIFRLFIPLPSRVHLSPRNECPTPARRISIFGYLSFPRADFIVLLADSQFKASYRATKREYFTEFSSCDPISDVFVIRHVLLRVYNLNTLSAIPKVCLSFPFVSGCTESRVVSHQRGLAHLLQDNSEHGTAWHGTPNGIDTSIKINDEK